MLDLAVKLARGDQMFQERGAIVWSGKSQLTQRPAESLTCAPTVEMFGAGVPKCNAVSLKVPGDNGIMRAIDNVGLLAQELFGFLALILKSLLREHMFDRLAQTRQPVLQQIVRRTQAHGRYGGFFTDRSRYDNEGNLQPALLYHLQSAQPAELRHRIVR